jgi:hypothetical protein
MNGLNELKTRITGKRLVVVGNKPDPKQPGAAYDLVCRINDARTRVSLFDGKTDILFIDPRKGLSIERKKATMEVMAVASAIFLTMPPSQEDKDFIESIGATGKTWDLSSILVPVMGVATTGGMALCALSMATNNRMVTCYGMAGPNDIEQYLAATGMSGCLVQEKAIRTMHLMI